MVQVLRFCQCYVYYDVNMINFCSPTLNPTVKCSTVSTDGYEVTNLVSSDADEARKGFLAYRAIKPPVSITINFCCRVNVSHVILWAQVGYQKSTGFEIYANCASRTKPEEYQKAAFGYLQEDEVGIIFYRRIHYQECLKSTKNLNSFAWKAIPGSTCFFLNNTGSLQIKIIKTKSSVPALARVEVWGRPSTSCDEIVQHNIFQLWAHTLPKKETVCCDPESPLQTDHDSDVEFEIPEEFLDSITFTVMAVPFILPCGKVVDRSTLDKHGQHEATWGRLPSDPFTGKLFTENSQPIPATALKACIDKFLIEHSDKHELASLPRTTGWKKKSSINDTRFSTEPSAYIKPSTSVGHTVEDKEMTCMAVVEDTCQSSSKRPRYGAEARVILCGESHEEELDRSLSSAVECTLVGLPKFTRFSSHLLLQQCAMCCSDNILFTLPCKHFLCRVCLVLKKESNDLSCNVCKACFKSCDPVRYHV